MTTKKKYLLGALIVCLVLVALGGGVAIGIYIRNTTLDPRASFPGAVERLLSFLVKEGEKEEDDLLYVKTDLASFIASGSTSTKVEVEGIVDTVAPQADGDYHILLHPPLLPFLSLVAEAIPEIPLPLPKEGDHIRLWGIVRFDAVHNWWEIHPVIGWEKLQ